MIFSDKQFAEQHFSNYTGDSDEKKNFGKNIGSLIIGLILFFAFVIILTIYSGFDSRKK